HMGDRPAQLDRIIVNVIGGADLGISKVNEIMSLVSKRFGSREDIVFGAVIDEGRHESLEICILGKADMEGKPAKAPEKSVKAVQQSTVEGGLGLETEIAQENKAPRPVHSSKLSKKKAAEIEANQDEFTFIYNDAQRGYFEKTDRNEYNGEDLDVPTFMRRGIKIKIK
ncbi:MAG: hypothetical protein NWR36_00365, partial [Opitutales bacterium]|nr:hypothetical protein [Opitutales bacterium]